MSTNDFSDLIEQALSAQQRFRDHWEAFNDSAEISFDKGKAVSVLTRLEEALNDNYPFFHPRYAGQMLKPPHPIAIAAYVMAMQINPNNHALDGGPATAKMEFDVVNRMASMFGYTEHLGHLTSSGTIANLEALWVAKSLHPEKAIAFSNDAHYTHRRMCEVLGARYVVLDSFSNLGRRIEEDGIGTIVVTIGTTSTGSVEPLHDIVGIAREHGVRIHADAAYGGFFTLVARSQRPNIDPLPFLSLGEASSIVVDPHKHGLQPYGCGCIIFKDPSVGKLYKHDSPYTYFTSEDLHLGEISLECSRPGASAAALWATLEYFPLEPDKGLGPILTTTRSAALEFASRLQQGGHYVCFAEPDLDIVTYFPRTPEFSATAISALSSRIMKECMERKSNPLYLATLIVDSQAIKKRFENFIADAPTTTILRSVLMKPEHYDFVQTIVDELEYFNHHVQ